MKVLGIETSCDETGVAVFDRDAGLLGDRLHSQVALHAAHGGVVPELASRDHVSRLAPMVRELLAALELRAGDLDGVAYTAGPGLVGALLVGAAFGEALALAIARPAIPVHHMEGHLLAPLLEPDPPAFPFVALLVSGGHTMLVEVAALGCYRLLGETLDDAAGEAFDKTARLLGLAYPGGPAVATEAMAGDPGRYPFPRPMTDRPGLDFSFSGLKTHTLRLWDTVGRDPACRADIAAGFERAVVDTLTIKCRRAIEASGFRRLVVAGGVGANRQLRSRLGAEGAKRGFSVHFPRLAWCTDNGAMIALAGALRLSAPRTIGTPGEVIARPRWPLATLAPPAAA